MVKEGKINMVKRVEIEKNIKIKVLRDKQDMYNSDSSIDAETESVRKTHKQEEEYLGTLKIINLV